MVKHIVSLLIGQPKQVSNDSNIDQSNIDRLEDLTGKLIASKSEPKGPPPEIFTFRPVKNTQRTMVKV